MTTRRKDENPRSIDKARLADYMHAYVDGFAGPLTLSQFSGGQSNPTYKIETAGKSYVLRRKPPGKLLKSAHAVEREYRAIRALDGTDFPVPKAYVLCEDESVLGSVFYIMECVDGRIFWNFRMPELEPDERGAIFASMAENLARLHRLDHVELGLEDFGRPGNYFARQIGLWSRQFEQSPAPVHPKFAKMMEWLPKAIPDNDASCLIHGDYSVHNLLMHPSEPRIAAALDWELSTIGHPLADLFYSAMVYYIPDATGSGERSFVGFDCDAQGFPSLERYLQMYCEHAGRGPIENPSFYKAFILFRFAGIVRGVIDRIAGGNANDPEADPDRLGMHLDDLADSAHELACDAGMA